MRNEMKSPPIGEAGASGGEKKNEIELSREKKKELVSEIKAFFIDQRGEEIGDLQAELLSDFLINKVGITIYNQALADSRNWFRKRLEDLETDYYSLEKEEKNNQ